MGRDPQTQLDGARPWAERRAGMQTGTHQMRSVKPRCSCMEEEQLLSTDRMHSR